MKKIMVLVMFAVMLWGCTLKKPYVGRTVFYFNPLIARIGALPELGEITHKPFKITFGYSGPGVFTRYYNGTFTLIIVKDGVIVDSFNFMPRGDNLEKGMYESPAKNPFLQALFNVQCSKFNVFKRLSDNNFVKNDNLDFLQLNHVL
jgi:hypothetical protein